jgi:hypothetical protein
VPEGMTELIPPAVLKLIEAFMILIANFFEEPIRMIALQ